MTVVDLAGEKALRVPGQAGNGYANLTKAAEVPWPGSATLSFRIWIPQDYAGDVSIGMSNIAANAAGSTLAQNMAGSLRFTHAGSVQFHDGDFYVADQSVPTGEWVEFRLHMDSSTDRWSGVIVRDGTATPLPRGGGTISEFAFRGETGSNRLRYFALRVNAAHVSGSELFLDHILLEDVVILPPFPNPTVKRSRVTETIKGHVSRIDSAEKPPTPSSGLRAGAG